MSPTRSFDIIPDIHGQSGKLHSLLGKLGYQRKRGAWRHMDADRQIVFLGDFIDRGPNNAEVLKTVRELIDSGRALAVMGNHELNAIHFHTDDLNSGQPIRPHSEKNQKQHASFLSEFPLGSAEAKDAVSWMTTLPLWLDLGPFRAVHACWSEEAVGRLSSITETGILSLEQLIGSGSKSDPLYSDVNILTKGPETHLPDGWSFQDKNGEERLDVRLAWWRPLATTWRAAAMSVPDIEELPPGNLPEAASKVLYAKNAKPVFFGHYWLERHPLIEASNTCCLDCSAGTHGPLVAYRFEYGDEQVISLSSVTNLKG